ncbi:hypothetical protein BT93_E1980 [Corymbia citriodora subsp. variegata]|nr:hypothetical protein BT93_E1980 [Corymbia citriodora subsp. variegata]
MELASVEALVSPLLKLSTLVWEKLQKESELASSAKEELDDLNYMIEDIKAFLQNAYSRRSSMQSSKGASRECGSFSMPLKMPSMTYYDVNQIASGKVLLPTFATTTTNELCGRIKALKEMLGNYTAELKRISPRHTYELTSNHAQSSSTSDQSFSSTFSMETDHALVGIDEPRNQLVQWLTENDSISKVIFVHGPQGVGKTSLVGAVLRNENVKSHFKYYSAAELMKANAKVWDLTERDNQGKQVELEQAFTRMRNNDYRWVLVLDDVGSTHVFRSLQIHLDQTRPSMLVTTRVSNLESISRAFLDFPGAQPGGAPPVLVKHSHGFHNHFIDFFTGISRAFLNSLGTQPRGAPPRSRKRLYGSYSYKHVFLSPDDSFTLFCQKMFPDHRRPIELKEASHSIFKRSEGLLLAILASCNLLMDNQSSYTGTPDGVKWKKLSDRLGEELLAKGDASGPIGRMITLRMDYLLDVRACLFYLSIFPLDFPIRCSTMMRLWMAERFIKQEGTKSVQEKAEETLDKLLEHNVIREKKKTSYGRIRTCRVHNLLHQIIISKSKDEEFAMIDANLEERWPDNIWCLSFHSDKDRAYDGEWVKQLRSLLVFKAMSQKSLENLLEKVDRLKVPDLRRHLTKEDENYFQASLNTFPQKILQSKYLRYLSLRGTKVKKIPTGIKDLAHLETLDLRGTLVHELPNGILKLKALHHLLVYRFNGSPAAYSDPKLGVKAPSKLGVLISLQKLSMIELNPVERSKLKKKRGKGQLLEELGKLAKLQRLGISMLRHADVELLCSSIEKLTNLEALRLIAAEGEKIDLSKEHKKKAPVYLQRVHLTGCLGTLPSWILPPDSLVKLVLKRSQLMQNPLQHLGKLRCLKHLELEQAFDVFDMKFEAGKFQQLCFLGLDKFDKLASIRVEDGALPTLERLSLARCKLLTMVPQDITHPRKLKCLELCGLPEEFNTAVKRNEKVRTHIKVKFKDWRDGAVEEVITVSAPHHMGSPSAALPCMK